MRVLLCDVGPRDGLQNEPDVLAPAVRAELAERIAGAGVPRVEAASFVRDDLVPAMAGAEEVAAALPERDGVEWAGLVLNERGLERLRTTRLDRVSLTLGATEGFNRRNANASLAQSVERARAMIAAADRPVTVTVSVAWCDPWEGDVDPGVVVDVVEQVADADEVVLADTIGAATPGRVRALIERVAALGVTVGGHFHDTRGTGVANAWAAVEGGATVLDGSVGGLGGCPFAPGSAGNVATEDLVFLLEREGIGTGVDLDGLVGVARWLGEVLGRPLPGRVASAGPFRPQPA